MKRFIIALWVCAVAVVAAYAEDTGQPVFHKYSFSDNGIITRMSDNGLWAVAQAGSSDDRKSGRAKLVNLTTDDYQTLQTEAEVTRDGACYVSDVTDDGNIVTGEVAGMPAYYNKVKGAWTKLPVPSECNGGMVSAVTPDGKYAVGVCTYAENDYYARGAMWNLTTNSLMELPNLPTLDMNHENQKQYKFSDISPDGRYVLASMSYSYLQPVALCSYVYDRESSTYSFIGFTPSDTKNWTAHVTGLLYIDFPVMSPNGQWITGTAYMYKSNGEEYEAPMRYEVKTGKLEVYDEDESHGMAGFSVDNAGTVYGATPGSGSPLREWSVRYNGYWYTINQILSQKYGIDYFAKTGYDYTGTPVSLNGEGTKIASMVDPTGKSYIIDLPVPAVELCAGINLLGNYSITPADGGVFTTLRNVEITFDRDIEVLGERNSVVLKDSKGDKVDNSIGCAVSNRNSKILVVTFIPKTLTKGETYTVDIPAGTVCLANDELKTNEAITIKYTGRGTDPVAPTLIYPADGSELARIDASSSPVMVTFDADVAVTDTAAAQMLYEDGSVCCEMSVLASGNRIAIYPATTQYLYQNNSYKVVLKAGSVTDVTGSGPNEEQTINYVGTYERQLSTDDATLFKDDFSNMSQSLATYLRYDGDKLTPTQAMQTMEFDAENQPWNLSIRESGESTDLCAASHSMYTPAGQSDDWMVIPQLELTDENCTLSFDAQSYLKSKADRLKVYVWVNDEVLTRLTDETMTRFKAEAKLVFDEQLSPGESEEGLAGDWEHYAVDLSEFGGKNVYIAFVNDNNDQSMVFVDNIEVKRNLKYLLSLSTNESVVNQESVKIAGRLTVNSDNDTYTSVELTLNDAAGNAIDKVSKTGLSLKKGDAYSFEFTKQLPLTVGEVNKFTIGVKLDDYTDVANGSIKNLAFRPVKRVVLEECTGTTCPNCPQGIIVIEKLLETYKDQFIPISLHTYNGDQLGAGLSGYADAFGLKAAPTGIVNRNGVISGPMKTNPTTGDYEMSNGYNLWMDYVAQELDVPADADIDAEVVLDKENGKFSIPVKVKYALNAKSLNLNLFVTVLEDGINSYQQNNLASFRDPIFGEWGLGGIYGSAIVYNFIHNDVARAYYGNVNGTGGYLPQSMTAGTEQTATIENLDIPENLNDITMAKAVVMLIDANNNKLINSVCAKFPEYGTGIDAVEDSSSKGYSISVGAGNVSANGDGESTLSLYTTAGVLLGQAKGNGTVTVSTNGYHGAVIARVVGKSGTVVKKIAIR